MFPYDNTNTYKDDPHLTHGRHESVYTEMELLDIYQDILNIQAQAPGPVAPVADEFEERTNDRTSVHSLLDRLDANLPPEPGTSQSHAIGADLRGTMSRYQRAVSRVAVILEGKDNATGHPDPPSPQNTTNQQILLSPPELAALVRECVSTLGHESTGYRFGLSRSARRTGNLPHCYWTR